MTDRCPRCQSTLAEPQPARCPCCCLTLGAPFDPTAGVEEGRRYLGRTIGRHFRVLSILACGGHGMVLLVRHTQLENRNIFALKLLRPELSMNEDFRRRFLREAEIVYTFSHPNIVPIREFAETEEGELFFTMDYCRGVTLDEAMRKGAPIKLPRILRIADGILLGLGYAHSHGVVHRDLKPANVFLEESRGEELARILDFGIAKPSKSGGVELTGAQKIIGTPTYMAPEQILGKPLDCRTDLYSFGVLVYRMVAGKPPFSGRTGHEVLARHLRDEPVPLRKIKPDVPKGLSELVEKLLLKPREHRPESAAVVRESFLRLQAASGSGGDANHAGTGRSVKARVLGIAAAAGVLAAVAYFGLSSAGRSAVASLREGGIGTAAAQAPTADVPPAPRAGGSETPDSGESEISEPESPDGAGAPPGRPGTWKWCRFCRKAHRVSLVTCPDCGQVLTRPPARPLKRVTNRLRPDPSR